MSVASGLKVLRIPIKIVGQTAGQWSGNNTPVTYLKKGTYLICYNVAFQVSVGSMSICQVILTQGLPFNSGGKELCGCKVNQLGTVAGTTPNGFCLQNTINIQNDNTPVYVGCFNTIAGGSVWGVPPNTQYDAFMNVLSIVQIYS
jgi:hypothetical protein